MSVRLVEGDGLVSRTAEWLWWASEVTLIDALNALDETGFKGLAAAILELDFEVGAVAVIDIAEGKAFVCGDAQLTSGGTILDGSTTGTWIEQRLEDPTNCAVNAFADTIDDFTSLIEGTTRAGGFVLGEPTLDTAPKPKQEATTDFTETVEAPEVVDAAEPEPEEPEEAEVLSPAEDHTISAQTLVIPSKAERDAALAAEEEETEETQGSDALAGRQVASVEFDDGRRLEVERGLLVGRNPESTELPTGYVSATVLGEFVSRRHWELDLDPSSLVIRDLGSAGGTIVEFPHSTVRLGPNETVAIEPTFRVLFADHSAHITVNPE